MDLYIYYRVRSEHAQQWQASISALQARLLREHGMVAALKRRPEEKDGCHTWMEIYPDVPEQFEAVLARAIAGEKSAALIEGERHTETFLDFSSCA